MTTEDLQASISEPQPWYAVRTFNCQEQKVSRFLTQRKLTHFIPMTLMEVPVTDDENGEKPKPILVPAVHNLLFIQKEGTQRSMMKHLSECPIPVSIFRHPGDQGLCEISARDMEELRLLCDPHYRAAEYMTQLEAEAQVGKDVRVTNGPFKGAIGRLVRKHKQYYFLKAVIGMGVMVRISRWYCEPL